MSVAAYPLCHVLVASGAVPSGVVTTLASHRARSGAPGPLQTARSLCAGSGSGLPPNPPAFDAPAGCTAAPMAATVSANETRPARTNDFLMTLRPPAESMTKYGRIRMEGQ